MFPLEILGSVIANPSQVYMFSWSGVLLPLMLQLGLRIMNSRTLKNINQWHHIDSND